MRRLTLPFPALKPFLFLAYSCSKEFNLFQMDVKSAFLNGYINEEVYVAQPLRFENHEYPNHIYKLKHALNGLKPLELGMRNIASSYLIKDTLEVSLILHSLVN